MGLFFICILAAVIVIILYLAIHRLLINRATMMVRNKAQEVTDFAVNDCLKSLLSWERTLSSQIVADVWGKGVLAFEYHFDYRKAGISLDDFTEEKLATRLDEYAKQHQLQIAPKATKAFVITDWWTYEGILHIDVAYLVNEATVEYIDDLKRLKHDSK